MPIQQKPNCPVCGTHRHVIVGSGKPGERYYLCQKCGGMFTDPDEGGDYSDRNPAARLEREGRRQGRKRA
jgi:transposase-like protein